MGARALSFALVALVLPAPAWTCAVCYGRGAPTGIIQGLTIGLFILIGFTFTILGSLGYAVYRIEKSKVAAERLS